MYSYFDDLPDDGLLNVPIYPRRRVFPNKKVLFIVGSVIVTVLLSIFVVSIVLRYIGKQKHRSSHNDFGTSTKVTASTILSSTAPTTIITTASK